MIDESKIIKSREKAASERQTRCSIINDQCIIAIIPPASKQCIPLVNQKANNAQVVARISSH